MFVLREKEEEEEGIIISIGLGTEADTDGKSILYNDQRERQKTPKIQFTGPD